VEPAGGDVVAGGGADGEGGGGGRGVPQRREHVQEGAGAQPWWFVLRVGGLG